MRTRLIPALVLTALVATLFAAGTAQAAGGVIVYETYGVYGGPADIHSVNPDGTGDVNLTPGTEDSMELDPAVSADGSKIAFVSNRVTSANPDGNFEVFTMGIDGSNVTQLTSSEDPFGQGSYQSFNPTWSPDGSQIAFDGYRVSYGGSEIFAINADGTGERQVTSSADQANKWRPDWSPDGSKILFTWGWDYYSQDVRTINPNGSGEANLTPDSVMSAEGSAVWSPDGTRIAFSGDGVFNGNSNREIFVMEYPSLARTQVTQHEDPDEEPAWSADGTEIVFTSPRDGRYALYVVAAPPVAAATGAPAQGGARSAAESAMSGAAAEPPVRKLNPGTGHESDPFWTAAGGGGGGTARTLTVNRAGTGSGRVTSSPSGITCGTDCSHGYSNGTQVTLTAAPASGSAFGGWSGATGCGGSITCVVTMDAARTVTATFTKAAAGSQTLTVTKQGRGRVTSSPAGITCGTDCTEAYAGGTVVTLSASPGRGYRLSGWSGACSGSSATCTVTMSAARSVKATFVRA